MYDEPFFADIRNWQTQIKAQTNGKNLLNPCPMRDHNAMLRQFIRKHEAEPTDHNAAEALQDANYAEGMEPYDVHWQHIVDGLWEKKYVRNETVNDPEINKLVQSADEKVLEDAVSGG